MLNKLIAPAVLGAVAVATFSPVAASAQSFGVYVGTGGPGYYDSGYGDRGYYYDRDARREAWIAHERWEQRERWERDQARRAYWEHRRLEDQQRRHYWNHERWEHRRDHDDWNEDDD